MATEYDGGVDEIEEDAVLKEPWRSTAIPLREEYVQWAGEQHRLRQVYGVGKYGPVTFKGDPLDQGIEENLDQLFYLYWAKRQLEFVEGQRNTYRHLLEAVMEFGLTEGIFEDIAKELQ